MSKKLVFVLALALTAVPLAANALGLGEIKLNSALNQPLSADIAVVSAAPDEIDSLHVKLASAAQFKQAGIPMADVLSKLQFKVVPGANGTATIHVSSAQPFREPFMDVLLDVTWDNGELIREYTVFLNPPNFESTTQAAPAPAPATTAPVSAAPLVAAPAPGTAAPAAASMAKPVVAAPAAPMQATAPQAATPAPAPVAAVPSETELGGNYGPIHRGETLSEIALKLRPQGVTLNQMMIAIYRANPEVFMRNINLMKAGYVLRIPSADDIQAVQVADANTEVRTQIAEWRSRRGLAGAHPRAGAATAEQPSLTLVAPSSAAQTAENQVPSAGKGGSGTSAAKAAGTGRAAAAATTAKAPIMLASSGLAAVQAQASKENKQPAGTKVTPLAPEKPLAVKPLPPVKGPARTQPAESGGLLGSLNPYIIIPLIVVVIILIIIGLIRRKQRNAPPVSRKPVKSGGRAPAAPAADWGKEETTGLKDVTAKPAGGKRGDATASAKTRLGGASKSDAASGAAAAHKPGEGDAIAESDFHMAYGLYDQAAEVLKKGLAQDPSRRDLKLKLLEVYFSAGDRANFVEAARNLRQEMGAAPGPDWEKVAIMGRQVAADDPLFAAEAAAPGAAAASVDFPLDSGTAGAAVPTDLDPLAGAFEGVHRLEMPETPPETKPAEDKHVVDFELPDIEPVPLKAKEAPKPAETKPAAPAAKPKAKPGTTTMTADFGTESQVEFDKALKELSDFVSTNVPRQDQGTRSGAALSLAADADVDAPGPMSGTGTVAGTASQVGEETTSLNEIGTKLDLARAYIDMGDSEGAKNILNEVLEEGDSQQKQEARKLMQQLG
ncbi:MAG TPA: FimV/HubP family polar landmark protein [Gammaproteobacteria bacterium]|nr:FimV/HubP family polar landmark protein [Gammaproteobacteria bacterium]